MIELVLFAVTLLLAYANGANDNFKGVATLYGSGVLPYRRAKFLATAATLIGAVGAAVLAEQLAQAFSGRGLVPNSVVSQPTFAIAVALAAGITVLLATRIGMPISTTHALVGGLAGAGLAAAGAINGGVLAKQFVLPLLLGPFIAFGIASIVNRVASHWWSRNRASQDCVCITASPAVNMSNGAAVMSTNASRIAIGDSNSAACATPLAITASSALNLAHIVSAGMVCAARGLNDAPKIVGLLLVAKSANASFSLPLVALAMALGGWLHARRVANTMSLEISTLEPRSAFIANMCTSILVMSASKFGLPLSTTHVSVGAISGLSYSGSQSAPLSWGTMKHIFLAWLFTLPVAATLAFAIHFLLNTFFVNNAPSI
jgi:inorganic phosphate transporter, PiT family